MNKNLVEVKNRGDAGSVGYTIPDRGIWRSFSAGETKKIELEELQALQYVPGGDYILKHFLMIRDKDALSALNIITEPEYFYTEKEVKELLTTGTLDQLKDCLDFAPEGVIELIKTLAVKMQLPDTLKRAAIEEKTGFSVNNAIMVNKVMDEEPEVKEEQKSARRATPIATGEEKPARRTNLPKYNVVTVKSE